MNPRSYAVPAAALTAVLALGGCTSSSSTATAAASASATASTGSSAAQASGATQPSSTSGQASQASGGAGVCQVANLSFALGAKSTTSSQTIQVVELTNKGAGACTMDGFAGVDLVGNAAGQSGYRWPLERESDSYAKVTLQPAGSAHFSVKYLPFASGDGTEIGVTSITITPPNTYSSAHLAWSAAILLQDAAEHPGTYITPIAAGS